MKGRRKNKTTKWFVQERWRQQARSKLDKGSHGKLLDIGGRSGSNLEPAGKLCGRIVTAKT